MIELDEEVPKVEVEKFADSANQALEGIQKNCSKYISIISNKRFSYQ